MTEHVLEAVPEWGVAALDTLHECDRQRLEQITKLEARVAALEPVYEQCPDCKALLERVAALEEFQVDSESWYENLRAIGEPEPYP